MAKDNEIMTGATPDGAAGGGQSIGTTDGHSGGGQGSAALSKKDAFMKGFREKHADWADDDEEGFYGALTDDAAAMDAERESWGKEREGYQAREKEVTDAIGGSVLNAALFNRAQKGEPLPLALLTLYPEEFMAYMDNPANTDDIKKVLQQHADDLEENKKLDDEAKANLEETNAVIDQMIADGEIADDEEANELLKMLSTMALGLMMNKVDKDWLLAAKKAMNHDADVEAARTQGEIDGRNQRITAQRRDNRKGGNTHSGLGSPNAGQRLSRSETRDAMGGKPNDMWSGMKVNKLN